MVERIILRETGEEGVSAADYSPSFDHRFFVLVLYLEHVLPELLLCSALLGRAVGAVRLQVTGRYETVNKKK